MDLHDDVVIGNHSTAPTVLDFYQVKSTKHATYKRSNLLRRKRIKNRQKGGKKLSLSTLGKLYLHKITFGQAAGKLVFVCNVPCGGLFDSRFKNSKDVPFSKVLTPHRRTILNQLREEHDLADDPDCDTCLRFVVTNLGALTHDRDIQGDVSQFCATIWPDGNFPVNRLYDVLARQLRSASDHEVLPNTVDELLRKKAISSDDLKFILDKLGVPPAIKMLWHSAQNALTAEGVGPVRSRSLRSGWNQYGVQRMDASNRAVGKLRQKIVETINAVEATGGDPGFVKFAQEVAGKLGNVCAAFSEAYVMGAILLELFDDDPTGELPSADPEPTGEAT
jgi:hypothetical protein